MDRVGSNRRSNFPGIASILIGHKPAYRGGPSRDHPLRNFRQEKFRRILAVFFFLLPRCLRFYVLTPTSFFLLVLPCLSSGTTFPPLFSLIYCLPSSEWLPPASFPSVFPFGSLDPLFPHLFLPPPSPPFTSLLPPFLFSFFFFFLPFFSFSLLPTFLSSFPLSFFFSPSFFLPPSFFFSSLFFSLFGPLSFPSPPPLPQFFFFFFFPSFFLFPLFLFLFSYPLPSLFFPFFPFFFPPSVCQICSVLFRLLIYLGFVCRLPSS